MLNRAHEETEKVVTVLENMAGAGNVIGGRFEELRDIIKDVEDKSRVGVCIDTCHGFAAGYDLRTPGAFAETMKAFDDTVGMKYLRAFHRRPCPLPYRRHPWVLADQHAVNDSKAPLGSNRDLHANIGTGYLGLRAFHTLVNDERFVDMPMVLETPIDRKGPDGKTFEDKKVWADEIKLLERLIGMDVESEEFKTEEKRLWEEGKGERERIGEQVDKRIVKEREKEEKVKAREEKAKAKASGTNGKVNSTKGKGRKKKVEETDESE